MKFCYPAVIRQCEDGSFSVRFPDLDGCKAVGRDLEDALREAKEAEREWLTVEILEDMQNPPYMSDLSEITTEEGETVRLLSVNLRLMEGWDE